MAEGAVNQILDVYDPVARATLPALTFGEAMVDLTGAGVFDADACVSFGRAQVRSRSSDSFTASLKDFIEPISVSVTNCANVTIRKNAVPDDPQDFAFVASAPLDPTSFDLDDDGNEGNGLASSRTFSGRYEGTIHVAEQGAWTVYAWAHLPNPAQLLVCARNCPLARSMRSIPTGFAGVLKRRHHRLRRHSSNRYHSIMGNLG